MTDLCNKRPILPFSHIADHVRGSNGNAVQLNQGQMLLFNHERKLPYSYMIECTDVVILCMISSKG